MKHNNTKSTQTISIDCLIISETPKAIAIIVDETRPDDYTWIPHSQILNLSELNIPALNGSGKPTTVEIPWWLAEEKGLV